MTPIINFYKNIDTEKGRGRIVVMLFSTLIGLGFIYLFLVSQVVFNVVAYESLKEDIPKVNAELQQRIFKKITLQNIVDKDSLEKNGFVVLSDSRVEYISRDTIGLRSTME